MSEQIRQDAKVVTITDLSPEDLDRVMRDYTDSGANVTTFRQPDGKYKIEARFPFGAKYPASKRDLSA
jgi:hypothetical protein